MDQIQILLFGSSTKLSEGYWMYRRASTKPIRSKLLSVCSHSVNNFTMVVQKNQLVFAVVLLMPAVGMILALIIIVITSTTNQSLIVSLITILLLQYILLCAYILHKYKVNTHGRL